MACDGAPVVEDVGAERASFDRSWLARLAAVADRQDRGEQSEPLFVMAADVRAWLASLGGVQDPPTRCRGRKLI